MSAQAECRKGVGLEHEDDEGTTETKYKGKTAMRNAKPVGQPASPGEKADGRRERATYPARNKARVARKTAANPHRNKAQT